MDLSARRTDWPVAQHSADAIELAEVVDLSDPASGVRDDPFQLNDRVHRLYGESEPATWGTIVGRDDNDHWLVRDNLGVTHSDGAEELSIARRVRSGMRHGSAGRPARPFAPDVKPV